METFTNGRLRFDVDDRGPADAEAVILLHGFPADRHCWDAVSARLVDAGYRTLAPDQRGYSPGARPTARRDYRMALLGDDILELAGQAGIDRFHVVGHDWGAAVAWHLGGAHRDRIRTLTAVSVPHPRAFVAAMATGTQALHSWYMLAFQLPGLPERLLGRRGGEGLRRSLVASGLGAGAARRYAARAAAPGAMTGPLGWYRALPWSAAQPARSVAVPTLMVWGSADGFLTRRAAEGSGRWVTGPYHFVEIPDGSHWLPEQRPDAVADALLEHLARRRAS